MEVNMLNPAVQAQAAPDISRDITNRAEPPPTESRRARRQERQEAAEARSEQPNITIRSGRFRTSFSLSPRKSSLIGLPEVRNRTRVAIERDPETDQFRAVKQTIERANKRMIGGNSMFQYSIHEQTNQIMIRVIDRETKELILEIPPEKALDAIAKMWEMAGIFVDERR